MARGTISRFRGVVLLAFFSCFAVTLNADTYILSYKTQVKNNQIIYQSLYASKAMRKVTKKAGKSTTIFLDKECNKKHFFICYEEEILNILLKSDVIIKATAVTEKLVAQSFSELQISPQYVQVDFNDTFVKISLLK